MNAEDSVGQEYRCGSIMNHGTEAYVYQRRIGQGPFGEVWKAQEKASLNWFTIKKVNKAKVSRVLNQLHREINTMYKVDHANIAKIRFHFEDNDCIYIGMDPIEGITLSQKLFIEKTLSQSSAALYFSKVLAAIEYLHSFDPPIFCKNINPDNILVAVNEHLTIIDFFWGDSCSEFTTNYTASSTMEYIAPEILDRGDYSAYSDVWCLGILLYEMIYGRKPFKFGKSYRELEEIDINAVKFDDADSLLKDLLGGMLQKDPSKRVGIKEIRSHEWLLKNLVTCSDESLRRYSGKSEEYPYYSSIDLLDQCCARELAETKNLIDRNKNFSTEIQYSLSIVSKLEEKIALLAETNQSISESAICLEKNIHECDEIIENFPESSMGLTQSNLIYFTDVLNKLQERICLLTEIRGMKSEHIGNLNAQHDERKTLLESITAVLDEYLVRESKNGAETDILGKELLYLNYISEEDVKVLSIHINSSMSELKVSCESIRKRIDDAYNSTDAKEKSISELSSVYNENMSEIKRKFNESQFEILTSCKTMSDDSTLDLEGKSLANLSLDEFNRNEDALEELSKIKIKAIVRII